jgi:spore germination cell wall hydrolase CwlJ-like protein
MNRLQSGEFGDSVCEVVGQKGQFASGVLSRKMDSKALPDVVAAADAVLKGERHPAVKNAMFFHTAGLRFPYKNMHYVLQAGGNAFYEKRSRHRMPRLDAEAQVAEAAVPRGQEAAERSAAVAAPVRSGTGQNVAAAAPQMIGGAVVQRVAATSATVEQRAFAYEADPKAVTAVGAMIAAQKRPTTQAE